MDSKRRTTKVRLPQCSVGSLVRTTAIMAEANAAAVRMPWIAANRNSAPGATETNSKSRDARASIPHVYQARNLADIVVSLADEGAVVVPVSRAAERHPSPAGAAGETLCRAKP